MSSRSFRRRNSRRRHRPASADPQRSNPPVKRETVHPLRRIRRVPRKTGQRRAAGPAQQPGRAADQRPAQQQGRAADQRPAQQQAPLPSPDCPVCGKPVRELASALTHRASHQPAHFDCIVRELRDSTEIAPQEKLCYLGAGSFGVLEFRAPGGPSRFVIKKRIQYEEKEIPQEWKKPLQISS